MYYTKKISHEHKKNRQKFLYTHSKKNHSLFIWYMAKNEREKNKSIVIQRTTA
jgi:hypothetical protein